MPWIWGFSWVWVWTRWRIQILRISNIFKIHEFYWILKMLSEFYFEIQYFNFEWKITITLLHSRINTQQWQVKTQISVIQSQNQQQPVVPIQQLFQHSSQPECSPVRWVRFISSTFRRLICGLHQAPLPVSEVSSKPPPRPPSHVKCIETVPRVSDINVF